MSENWKIQVSLKTLKGALINVRADTGDEQQRGLAWVREHAQEILDTEALLAGAAAVVAAGATAPAGQAVVNVTPSQPEQATKRCSHGDMKWVPRKDTWNARVKSGAWMCSAPQGTPDAQKCKPEFI
jgi:hypothetical protein